MNNKEIKISPYIGFAIKSGETQIGVDNINKGAKVILYDTALAENSTNKLIKIAEELKVNCIAVNFLKIKSIPAGIKVIAIKNASLAKQILSLLKMEEVN
ncbi:MAG: hypothetical protein ACI4T8_04390 [Christensenellales bacterium]